MRGCWLVTELQLGTSQNSLSLVIVLQVGKAKCLMMLMIRLDLKHEHPCHYSKNRHERQFKTDVKKKQTTDVYTGDVKS